MELIDGKPINQFCDEHRLTIKQRLQLFIPVCLAVQQAHQKGNHPPGHQAIECPRCDSRRLPGS